MKIKYNSISKNLAEQAIVILLITFLISSCNLTEEKRIKLALVYEHKITNGEIDTTKKLTSQLLFNKYGNCIEERDIDEIGQIERIKKYKYTSDTLLLECSHYLKDEIEYKKIYEYTNGYNTSVKVYYSKIRRESDDLQLWGALNIYRDATGKPTRKAYIGGINLFADDRNVMIDPATSELRYSKTDSTIAIYKYNTNGKIDSIKIYDGVYSLSTIEDGKLKTIRNFEFYKYSYDARGNIVNIVAPDNITSEYHYTGDTLLYKIKKHLYESWFEKTEFNPDGNVRSIQMSSQTESYNSRLEYSYDAWGNELNRTRFNYLNEPVFHSSRKLIYY
jgi:YD repeat-containing protein